MYQDILTVFVTAMLPISELRGAIPLGLFAYGLSPGLVYLVAVVGNILPVYLLLIFWMRASTWLAKKIPVFNRFLDWLFERTRKKFYNKYEKFGNLALVIFVAIPLPMTGAWTGSVAAWLFDIPYHKAIGLTLVGLLISGFIVTLLSLGVIKII